MTTKVTVNNPHSDRVVRISKRSTASGNNIHTMTARNGEFVEYIHAGQYLVISEHGEHEDIDINESFNGLCFGQAIKSLKSGKKVARSGWNGKGMWLVLVSGYDVLATVEDVEPSPYIGMKTADNKFVPWLASQTDVLSEDWVIVD